MSRNHESYNIQPKIIAMAVRSACLDIGIEYSRKQMEAQFKRLEDQGLTPTGRVPTTEPQIQELPK